MKSPVQDESTNDLPVFKGPFVSKEKESDVVQGSKRMQQKPAKKLTLHICLEEWIHSKKLLQLSDWYFRNSYYLTVLQYSQFAALTSRLN